MNGSREPGRASLTASPSRTNKSFASRDRNGFPLDARADADFPRQGRNRRVVTRERDERKAPVTRRTSREKKKKKTAPCWYRTRFGFDTSARRVAPHLARGVLGFWSRFERTPAIPSAPDVDDVRLSLHVHGQPRGVGRWPRRHRRAHGSRRGEQGRRRRKQRVLPRQGVRQDDDEVVARGCVRPPIPGRTRTPERAATRPRARPPRAKRPRPQNAPRRRAPGSARRRRVGPRRAARGCREKASRRAPWLFPFTRLSRRESYPSSFIRARDSRHETRVRRADLSIVL